MAYNWDKNKGLYPDEEGYRETRGKFLRERAIEGKATTKFNYIQSQTFHDKLMKSRALIIMRDSHPTYTDIKVRNDIEMTENKKYFQPKEWNTEKLMFNYDALWHLSARDFKIYEQLVELLKLELKRLYNEYNVPKDKQLESVYVG